METCTIHTDGSWVLCRKRTNAMTLEGRPGMLIELYVLSRVSDQVIIESLCGAEPGSHIQW